MIGHTRADQLLSQLLMDSLNTLLSHYRHIGNLHEEIDAEKIFFFTKWQLCELRHFFQLILNELIHEKTCFLHIFMAFVF